MIIKERSLSGIAFRLYKPTVSRPASSISILFLLHGRGLRASKEKVDWIAKKMLDALSSCDKELWIITLVSINDYGHSYDSRTQTGSSKPRSTDDQTKGKPQLEQKGRQ